MTGLSEVSYKEDKVINLSTGIRAVLTANVFDHL